MSRLDEPCVLLAASGKASRLGRGSPGRDDGPRIELEQRTRVEPLRGEIEPVLDRGSSSRHARGKPPRVREIARRERGHDGRPRKNAFGAAQNKKPPSRSAGGFISLDLSPRPNAF